MKIRIKIVDYHTKISTVLRQASIKANQGCDPIDELDVENYAGEVYHYTRMNNKYPDGVWIPGRWR